MQSILGVNRLQPEYVTKSVFTKWLTVTLQAESEHRATRTWYVPCSVPTRSVTSSTTERSCCSSCSSWKSRGGPGTTLPERRETHRTGIFTENNTCSSHGQEGSCIDSLLFLCSHKRKLSISKCREGLYIGVHGETLHLQDVKECLVSDIRGGRTMRSGALLFINHLFSDLL